MEQNIETLKGLMLDVISNGKTHPYYERVVSLANLYRKYVTGDKLDDELRQFVRRETETEFKQRVTLTQHVVPSMVNNVTSVERKIPRSNSMIRVVGYKNDESKEKAKQLEAIASVFWGNRSWDDYMAVRWFELNDIDPNAFIVFEWEDFDENKENAEPYPYEVFSDSAFMYEYNNNVLQYLFERHMVDVLPSEDDKPAAISLPYMQSNQADKPIQAFQYTLYGLDQTLVLEPIIDKAIQAQIKKEAEWNEIGDSTYIIFNKVLYELETPEPHNLHTVPAVRVGVLRDQLTDGNTCVSLYHSGECWLRKAIKLNSEIDLSTALHAFPQKVIAGHKCTNSKCLGGFVKDGSGNEIICPQCEGLGLEYHKSAQDVVVVKTPRGKDEEVNLDNVIRYISPDTATLDFQKSYLEEIYNRFVQSVFVSDVYNRAEVSTTATEQTINLQNIYDVLYPYALDYARTWKFGMELIASVTDKDNELVLSMSFSRDFKFKTKNDYIADRQLAVNANAPADVLSRIDDEIVRLDTADDPDAYLRYKVRQEFFPFEGKSETEIAAALSRNTVPRFQQVLYDNYGWIFDEIERANKDFYYLDKEKQWAIITTEVNKIMSESKEAKTGQITAY